MRRHLQLSTPGKAVEVRPLEGICALIICCLSGRTALVHLQTPSNIHGTAALHLLNLWENTSAWGKKSLASPNPGPEKSMVLAQPLLPVACPCSLNVEPWKVRCYLLAWSCEPRWWRACWSSGSVRLRRAWHSLQEQRCRFLGVFKQTCDMLSSLWTILVPSSCDLPALKVLSSLCTSCCFLKSWDELGQPPFRTGFSVTLLASVIRACGSSGMRQTADK